MIESVTRPPIKQSHVLRRIRRQILDGRYAPGSRIPTRSQLERRYSVSGITIQRAVEQLIDDGFLVASGRRGTFVVEQPPHLSRYALVFAYPKDLIDSSWFELAIHRAALGLERRAPGTMRFPMYFNMVARAESEDFRRLVRDIRAQQFAGVILGIAPAMLDHSPLETQDDDPMPRVALVSESGKPHMPAVYVDFESFFRRALEHLIKQGRKRIAIITPTPPASHSALRQIRNANLSVPPHWFHPLLAQDTYVIPSLARLLMSAASPVDRPDGLIIASDSHVDAAVTGLVAAGVRIGQDVEIVAHTNYPNPRPSIVPVTRLGFDARQLLQTSVQRIVQQRAGAVTPQVTLLPAYFEHEIHEMEGAGEPTAVR
jgi:DNA-binding LacI/PurR family transcriptional regulator/DNA-binding transcriptional regulator YhcF (GntR family)